MDLVQLVLINNSTQPGNMIVFKRYETPGTLVAWFSRYLYQRMRVAFSWNPSDWCFIWAATGDTGAGTLLDAAQTVPADHHENGAVVFSYDDVHRTFLFKNERPAPRAPFQPLTILQDEKVVSDAAAVGIGVAGRATFAVPSLANSRVQVDPRGTTWVTFGTAREGEFFDVKDTLEPVQVEFPPNVRSMTVTLNEDNSWSVTRNVMMLEDGESPAT